MIVLQPGQKDWGCAHKQEARSKTIIEPYQTLFGKSLPSTQQYWTLCGQLYNNGSITEGCELMQMVQSGLISPSQFHGIEGNPEIYNLNLKILQQPFDTVSLYQGEFSKVLDQQLRNNTLSPGIVYLDTIQEPQKSAALFATVLDIVNQTEGPALFIWNFIKEQKYRGRLYTWENVQEIVNKNSLCRNAIRGWNQFEIVQYNGTGKQSTTTMGSVVLFRE